MAFVPTELKFPRPLPVDPLPAIVLTLTIGEINRPAFVMAKVAAVVVELIDVEPHEITTPDGFESVKEDVLHFTQADIVNGVDPVGSDDNKGEDKYDPLEVIKAAFGKEVVFV